MFRSRWEARTLFPRCVSLVVGFAVMGYLVLVAS